MATRMVSIVILAATQLLGCVSTRTGRPRAASPADRPAPTPPEIMVMAVPVPGAYRLEIQLYSRFNPLEPSSFCDLTRGTEVILSSKGVPKCTTVGGPFGAAGGACIQGAEFFRVTLIMPVPPPGCSAGRYTFSFICNGHRSSESNEVQVGPE